MALKKHVFQDRIRNYVLTELWTSIAASFRHRNERSSMFVTSGAFKFLSRPEWGVEAAVIRMTSTISSCQTPNFWLTTTINYLLPWQIPAPCHNPIFPSILKVQLTQPCLHMTTMLDSTVWKILHATQTLREINYNDIGTSNNCLQCFEVPKCQ